MSNFNSDGPSGNEWEERGDLAWNEFDWERYLREQDESIGRYQKFYEASIDTPDRIDAVAAQMGWSLEDWTEEGGEIPDSDDDEEDDEDEFPEISLAVNEVLERFAPEAHWLTERDAVSLSDGTVSEKDLKDLREEWADRAYRRALARSYD